MSPLVTNLTNRTVPRQILCGPVDSGVRGTVSCRVEKRGLPSEIAARAQDFLYPSILFSGFSRGFLRDLHTKYVALLSVSADRKSVV